MKKFINWLRFNPPFALSLEDWEAFRREFKKSAPVRYFLTEVIYKRTRSRVLNSIRRIQDRVGFFIDPPNIIRIPVSDRESHGCHDLMLISAFTVLVNYVEIDLGVMETPMEERPWKNRWLHFLNYSYRIGKRQPANGIRHLIAEAEHIKQFYPDRAVFYEDALTLYLWWTITRKSRKLPEYPFKGQELTDSEKYKIIKDHSKLIQETHEKWLEEDNRMLSKLVLVMKDLN